MTRGRAPSTSSRTPFAEIAWQRAVLSSRVRIRLFADTVAGARASANLYGLIETAKANGIEPGRYLAHLFEALPTVDSAYQIQALLPQNVDPDVISSP